MQEGDKCYRGEKSSKRGLGRRQGVAILDAVVRAGLLEKGKLEADSQKVSVWARTACGDSTGKVDFISTGI